MWPKPFESEKSQNTKSDQMNTSLNSTDPRNCGKCGYEAEGLYDFDAHTWEVHDEDSVECQFCDKSFKNKVDLMNHKKEVHRENVESCWHYSAGFCPYGDRKCWFNHNKENSVEYNCNFCEQICRSQSDLRHHKKKKHKKRVPSCKNEECKYGRENCKK